MTDAQLQGTFWPTLNPDYRGDPTATIDNEPNDRMFNSVYSQDLTPEFLVREAIKRGWKSLPNRLNWYKEIEGGWEAECRCPKYGDTWQVFFVTDSSGDEGLDG